MNLHSKEPRTKKVSGKVPLPEPLYYKFRQFFQYCLDENMIIAVTLRSLTRAEIEVGLIETFYNTQNVLKKFGYDEMKPDKAWRDREVEQVNEIREFAKRQKEIGFPLIYTHAIISLWSVLEATVLDVAYLWLLEKPESLKADRLQKIKISLAEFMALDDSQRFRRLVDEIDRNMRGTSLAGVSRFEEILKVVDLGGPVPKDVRQKFYELYYVRNLIVHRGGIATPEFIDACPWPGLRVGDEIKITQEKYHEYFDAMLEYGKLLSRRVERKYTSKQKNTRRRRRAAAPAS